MARTALFRALNRSLSKVVKEEAEASGFSFTRRKGLQMAGSAAMAAYLNACKTTASDLSEERRGQGTDSSIVIVGGGAAGLTALHALKKAGVRAQLFEATERLGGRIYTQENFNQQGMFCERGGELIDTGHKEIHELAKELGLELERLPDDNLPSEVHYFQGTFQKHQDLIEGFRPFAKVIARDAAEFLVDGEFVMPSYKNHISKRIKTLDFMSLQEYLDQAPKACPKWVRNLIRVAYVGEYGLEAHEQSAINLVSFIGTDIDSGFKMFGESDELFRIKGGNSRLIERLAEECRASFTLDHKLRAISRNRKGVFQLLFEYKNKVVEVKADRVIMTLPFTVLRLIDGLDELGLSPRKIKAIRELGYGMNTKLMLGFHSRPWRDSGKTYPASDGGVLSDLDFQGGWETSRKQKGEAGIWTNFVGGDWGKSFSKANVKATLSDLDTIFPGISREHDGNTALQVWPAIATAKGSYICQKPGQYTTIGGSFGETECEGTLLFAGEHTSEEAAGFMSGAVESGLRAATELLDENTKSKKKSA